MAAVIVCLLLFLAMAGHSSATYCICKDGLSDSVLQKNIDYACGAGADCSQIMQNGACYNPSTVKDHCNFAVNSYFQRKSQAPGSCDFSGTAATAQTIPNQVSGCVYASSPSTAGGNSTSPTTTPSTTPTTTPSTTPSTTTPSTTTPSTGTTPTTTPSIFGIGPTTASGSTSSTDSKATVTTLPSKTFLFWSLIPTLLLSGPMFLMV